MLNRVLEAVGDGIDTEKGSLSVPGVLGGGAGGRPIPIKSLAEIVRMPERREVISLCCGALGVVGADIEDFGTLGA